MSAAAQTTNPDLPQTTAGTPGAHTPGAVGRVFSLLRKLIDYGTQLAAALQQRDAAPGGAAPEFAQLARPFGTADLAVILARITRGLRRAAALQACLCRRAARGQDLTPAPIRRPAARGRRATRRVASPEASPSSKRAGHIDDPRLAQLPTEEEIAAEVRRRPVGAVIVDICCDLGIAPGHLDRAFWDEINHAITLYRGSLARFFNDLGERLFAWFGDNADPADPVWSAAPPRLPAPAARPP